MPRREQYRARREHYAALELARYYRNRTAIRQKQNLARANWTPERRAQHSESQRRYRRDNHEAVQGAIKRWTKKHPEQFSAIQSRYRKKVRATTYGQLNSRMSKAIRGSLINGKEGRGWRDLVGYTASDLKKHLQSLFKPGMNWERLLNGEIHIDHVIPISKFKFNSADDIEFKRCWALENLAPEWASVNESKNNKILAPSQIPLGL